MIVKASFILFAIVLPLSALAALSALAFWVYGGQGVCFLPPLFGVYFFAMLVLFEVQKGRGNRQSAMGNGEEFGGGDGQSAVGNGEEVD